MMDQLVSVIIPCYNGEQFIDRSIGSVYEQDYPLVELIVVDDGSTDASKEKILAWSGRFKKKDWSLQYVFQENRGLGGAIDTGLKYITGAFLTLLDADDRFLEGSISKRANYLAQHPEVGVVRTNGWTVSGENRWLFVQEKGEKEEQEVFSALLQGKTNNWAGSYMVRTDLLFSFYPDRTIYPSRYGQNLQILLPLTYRRTCGFIDEPLMEYIRQDGSLSSGGKDQDAFVKACQNTKGYLDIRIHMVTRVVSDLEERDLALNQVQVAHFRLMMAIALEHKKITLLTESFAKLKQLQGAVIEDYILYYRLKCWPVSFVLRGVRRIRRKIRGGN